MNWVWFEFLFYCGTEDWTLGYITQVPTIEQYPQQRIRFTIQSHRQSLWPAACFSAGHWWKSRIPNQSLKEKPPEEAWPHSAYHGSVGVQERTNGCLWKRAGYLLTILSFTLQTNQFSKLEQQNISSFLHRSGQLFNVEKLKQASLVEFLYAKK